MFTNNANLLFINREKILEQLRDLLQYKNNKYARTTL